MHVTIHVTSLLAAQSNLCIESGGACVSLGSAWLEGTEFPFSITITTLHCRLITELECVDYVKPLRLEVCLYAAGTNTMTKTTNGALKQSAPKISGTGLT